MKICGHCGSGNDDSSRFCIHCGAPLMTQSGSGQQRQNSGSQGQATDIQIQAEQILKIKKKLNEILAENTGKDIAVIERDTERDHFMTAEEAREYGLIDKVIYKR